MSGITYEVKTVYSVEDKGASGGAAKISSAFEGLGKYADKAGGAMDAIAGKLFSVGMAATAVAGAGALGALKVGLVDVNAKLEDTTIGMASAFRMLGAAGSFDQGLGMAKSLIADIRSDAASLPGEFQDFVGMAQTLSAPLINAGKGLADIRNLTRDTVVASASLGVNFDQAAREMAQLLEGHAGGHNVLGTRLGISTSTLVNGKEFNKATSGERADFISKAMENAKDSLPAFARSWGGMTSTLSDNIKTLLGRTTAPLFERIKGTLWSIVGDGGMLEKNSARLGRLADSVGRGLVAAYDWLFHRGEWIVAHWESIRDSAITFGHSLHDALTKAWPIVERIGNFLGEKLKDPAGFMKELALLRGGVAVAGSAGSIATGASSIMTAFGGAGAAGGAAAAAGGAVAAAAIPLAVAAVATAGSLDILTQKAEENGSQYEALQKMAEATWGDVKRNFKGLIGDLTLTFTSLWTAVRPVVDVFGVMMIGALDAIIYALRALTYPLSQLAEGIAWVVGKIPGFSPSGGGGGTANPGEFWKSILEENALHAANKKANAGFDPNKAADDAIARQAEAAAKAAKGMHGGGKVQVNVTVPMTVLSDADPERLAVGIGKNIKDAFKHAVKSKATGLGSLAVD